MEELERLKLKISVLQHDYEQERIEKERIEKLLMVLIDEFNEKKSDLSNIAKELDLAQNMLIQYSLS